MPWAIFNRPSIQLGTLKAYLESKSPALTVDTSNTYLEVASLLGPELYHWISQNPWVSEALYAPLIFPDQKTSAENLADKYVRKADKNIRQSFQYKLLVEKLKNQLKNWGRSCDWTQYAIIGFSVCFHQLLSSLAAAKMIKKEHPNATIVFGGSSCGAGSGESLLQAFSFIDYVIEGEGESALLALCRLRSGAQPTSLPANVISRHLGSHDTAEPQNPALGIQLSSLADLPVPDYSDYVADQKKWFSHKPFIPVLPIEFSRGCWWNKCSFCNLNIQWCGYRYKKAAQMVHEVKTLSSRLGSLDFAFVDNMLPPEEALRFFQATGDNLSDYKFFAELRTAKSSMLLDEIFSVYRGGGLETIQVGIEALSITLLQKMRKGVTAIENIATMRSAQESNLTLEGNLILHFPGSTQAEVDETLEALDYVLPYHPLVAASFFLGHDSPIYREPQKYGIMAIVNHANNRRIFPGYVLQQLTLLVKDYRGDRAYQRKIWQPVTEKITKWKQFHEERNADFHKKPLLYYRDGIDFLLISQKLPDGIILHHRLKGISRQIYLFCTSIRTDTELFERFPSVSREKIITFLRDLQKKRLIFNEKNKYLALAVHFSDY